MLTEREVLEIAERAMGHQAVIEKYVDFSNHCNDPQVKNMLNQHQQIIQRHHQILLNFLNDNQTYNQQNVNRPEYTMV